jgi:hypothetical protein
VVFVLRLVAKYFSLTTVMFSQAVENGAEGHIAVSDFSPSGEKGVEEIS